MAPTVSLALAYPRQKPLARVLTHTPDSNDLSKFYLVQLARGGRIMSRRGASIVMAKLDAPKLLEPTPLLCYSSKRFLASAEKGLHSWIRLLTTLL